MWYRFFATDDSRVLTLQRLVLGGVMFGHGAQKLLGWFGGQGYAATMQVLGHTMPAPLAFLVVMSEAFGSILLALGLVTRFAAFGCASVMVGAIFMMHLKNGLFMNWFGAQHGEGFEYHLLAIALAIPLMFRGGGALSIDRWLARYLSSRRALHAAGKSGAAPTFAA